MSLSVLIVDDEENARLFLGEYLEKIGYNHIEAANLAQAREALRRGLADIILLDIALPDGYGPDLIPETQKASNRPPVIIITAFGDIERAVETIKAGAIDFIQKPIDFEQLGKALLKARELVEIRRELMNFRQVFHREFDFVLGRSPKMRKLFGLAQRAAEMSVNVLITGETGTGKEILARYIHLSGPRASRPFVPVNCAAIQTTVVETELFGYEAGAFTGADKNRIGLLDAANEGILFLDEIASMNREAQAKLLRIIEDQKFRRVGATKTRDMDVQFIAASNQSLPQLIREGVFREDLYFRLKVMDLHIPPLRERKDEIPELVGFLMKRGNQKMGLNIYEISSQAMSLLLQYDWPGNIRELRNVVESAMLVCDEPSLDVQHLSEDILTFAA